MQSNVILSIQMAVQTLIIRMMTDLTKAEAEFTSIWFSVI